MSDDPVVVVVPGDLHLTEPGLENDRVAHRMVDEINRLVRPDFVQFIGDNVQDATEAQFRLFDDLRRRLTVPHFALVGDHDVKDDPEARGFRAHVGETYGSTSLRGFRFIRLDTQQARPLGLSRQQVDWFRSEVDAAVGAGQRVVIFQHNYPYQIWEDFAGPGIDEWRTIVQSRWITMILCTTNFENLVRCARLSNWARFKVGRRPVGLGVVSAGSSLTTDHFGCGRRPRWGHTHYLQLANDGRNIAVATRSIGDPEGGPPGYLIAYFQGDDLAVAYRSVEDSGPIALIVHPCEAILATGPRHIVRGPDQIRVHTWSDATVAAVRGRVDDQPWITFEVDERVGACWSAPLHGDRLCKGEHTLAVEVGDEDDCWSLRSIRFMVDPSGRYTAIPRVEPLVERTAFC